MNTNKQIKNKKFIVTIKESGYGEKITSVHYCKTEEEAFTRAIKKEWGYAAIFIENNGLSTDGYSRSYGQIFKKFGRERTKTSLSNCVYIDVDELQEINN